MYGGTKTEMQRLLADAQKISGVKYDIANLNDVYSAIHVIQGELDITGTTAKEASTTLSGSFGSMKAAAKDFLGNLTLGQDIAPSLNALANTTTTFLFGNLLPALGNIFSALPGAIVTFISAAAPQMMTAASGMLNTLATGLSTNAPELISSVMMLITNLKNDIITNLPTILQAGTDTINSFITGMLNDIPNLITNMGIILTDLLGCILTALPSLQQSGYDIILNLVNGILSNLPSVISSIGTITSKMLDMLLSVLPNLLENGMRFIGELASGILNNLPQIVSSIGQVIGQLLATIASHLPDLLQKGIELIGEMAAGLIQAIPQIIGAIPQIVGAIFDTLGAVDWLELGGNIIKGIADGVANAGKVIINAVIDAAKGAFDAVKEFFGIKSPSRLMRDKVGKFIPAGIAVGIEGNVSPIKTAMKDIATLTTDSANVNIAKNLSYSTPDVPQPQTDSVGDKMDYIIRMMAKYLPSCAEKTVIDGKSLVNGIDRQLGLAVL